MRSLLLVVLCATLCSASSDIQPNIETLMDNVVVVWVPHRSGSIVNVRLTCGEAFQNQPVIWKKDGMELQPPLSGNQVTVQVEEMDGGNFTCHLGPNGEYLNHTVVLVQLESDNRTVILKEKSPEEGAIHCIAPNYDGSFHCTWTRTPSRSKAAVLLVKAERYMEKIHCELDADGSGVRCQDANCSHIEEQHRISLSVYIHSYSRLEVYTKNFYLKDIVKPEKIPNLHMSRGKVFSWDYPPSWSKPCSFFSLQFEVKVVQHGEPCTSEPIMSNFTNDTKYEVRVRAKKYVFCVRAHDQSTEGLWSNWSKCTVNKDTLTC